MLSKPVLVPSFAGMMKISAETKNGTFRSSENLNWSKIRFGLLTLRLTENSDKFMNGSIKVVVDNPVLKLIHM